MPVTRGKVVYYAPSTTAPVVVEGGRPWWLKILNPLEKRLEVRPGDVLAFAEATEAPLPTESQIKTFINQGKLIKNKTPVRLCYMATESIKVSMSGGEVPSMSP